MIIYNDKTEIVEDENTTAEELVYYLKIIDNQIEILALVSRLKMP